MFLFAPSIIIFTKINSMNKNNQSYKYIIKNDACQFDLQQTFNQLSMFALNPPQISFNNKQTLLPITLTVQKEQNKDNLVEVLTQIKGLKNTLRYIKLNPRNQNTKSDTPGKKQANCNSNQIPIDKQIFIRPTQEVLNGDKIFWLIRGLKQSSKQRLNLDSPTFVITFHTNHPTLIDGDQILVAIQRKCLTLYQVNESDVQLKDFDSVSVGKRLNIIQMKHVQYQGRNYVLIFGNQKQKKEDYLRCLVYEVNNMQFTFVKKATLWKGQIYSPTILFENYPKNEKEKFCLIVGGYYDSRSSNYYKGWQVDIHLLVTSWLSYPIDLTKQVPFNTRRQSILSGKAIKYNDFWYVFCTQNQTITQVKLDFHHGTLLETLHLSTIDLQLKEKIYFSENNIFLTLKGSLKLIMLNKSLEFRQKDFLQFVQRFDTH